MALASDHAIAPLLKNCGYLEHQQQILTGLTIGIVDSLLSTPLDGRKLAAIYGLEKRISWHGFPTYLSKRCVEWTTFLVAQNHFSKQELGENKRLSLRQSLYVAMQITACVSITRAPFDVANTLKQTGKSLQLKSISPLEFCAKMYRGAFLGFTSLLIYNFSTTLFINRLRECESNYYPTEIQKNRS